jgi:hypothetical protein
VGVEPVSPAPAPSGQRVCLPPAFFCVCWENNCPWGRYRSAWGWAATQASTWLEVFDPRWEKVHSWSGCPTWQLSKYTLGLTPRYDVGPRHFDLKLFVAASLLPSWKAEVANEDDVAASTSAAVSGSVPCRYATPFHLPELLPFLVAPTFVSVRAAASVSLRLSLQCVVCATSEGDAVAVSWRLKVAASGERARRTSVLYTLTTASSTADTAAVFVRGWGGSTKWAKLLGTATCTLSATVSP